MARRADFSTRPSPAGPRALDVGLVVAACALLAWTLTGWLGSRAESGATRASLEGLRSELVQARGRARQLEARRRSGRELLVSQVVLTAEAPATRVLAELAALLPTDVRFESVTLSYGARLEIDAQVAARRPAAYDLFLERLQGSPLFRDVLPGAEGREGELRARVRMSYAGTEAPR